MFLIPNIIYNLVETGDRTVSRYSSIDDGINELETPDNFKNSYCCKCNFSNNFWYFLVLHIMQCLMLVKIDDFCSSRNIIANIF